MRPAAPQTAPAAAAGPWDHRAWWLGLAVLTAWQAWLILTLFGPDRPWQRLLDDQPVVSGRHALHLYHGYLGARSLCDRGSVCCYDPNFQAGYPKTPVFDGGSRPAELFLLLGGGAYRPAAYKVGLALSLLAVPLLLAAAARGAGLNRAAACLTTAAGLLVCWGAPCRQLLEAGDLDVLLGALALVARTGLLLRFDRAPGLRCWLGLLAAGCLGWFAQPLLSVLFFPLFLVYYLTVGAQHRLGWHVALLVAVVGGVVVNLFWLADWFTYCWIQAPLTASTSLLSPRTWQAIWEAPLWGEPADRGLALLLVALGLVGVARLNYGGARPAARLLGLGMVGLLLVALFGAVWEPLGRLGSTRLLVPALWFAALPAVLALAGVLGLLRRWTGSPWYAAAAAAALAVAAAVLVPQALVRERLRGSTPLAVGLGADREALVEALRRETTPAARILWEDRRQRPALWTPLLPLLTERAYLGGLDPDAGIEHAHVSLTEQTLAGRPLTEWDDDALAELCWQYNVGWVVCWSPAAVARFRNWSDATAIAPVRDGGDGWLFRIGRPHGYVLRGEGEWLKADCRRVALGDVRPAADGTVVLGLHYQAGLQVSPRSIQIERDLEANPADPIPFVRLRLPGPVTRVTLTWEGR
jgi:hypothetical protein